MGGEVDFQADGQTAAVVPFVDAIGLSSCRSVDETQRGFVAAPQSETEVVCHTKGHTAEEAYVSTEARGEGQGRARHIVCHCPMAARVALFCDYVTLIFMMSQVEEVRMEQGPDVWLKQPLGR